MLYSTIPHIYRLHHVANRDNVFQYPEDLLGLHSYTPPDTHICRLHHVQHNGYFYLYHECFS